MTAKRNQVRPPRRKPIPKQLRLLVYAKCNNHCGYCGTKLLLKDMQVDHIFPNSGGGSNDLANLMPACRRCNHYKSDYPLEQFRLLMIGLHERIQKHYINKVAMDYGIIQFKKPFDGKFFFEKMKDFKH